MKYRSLVCLLLYFQVCTRVDCSYAVSNLCKFLQNPGWNHVLALKHVQRYLAGTCQYCLEYNFGSREFSGVHGYSDASYADNVDSMRSTMAFVFRLGLGPITWKSKAIGYVTTCVNHSEYCALSEAARESVWIDGMLAALDPGEVWRPIPIFCDNSGALAMAYNPISHNRSKHIRVAVHYTRNLWKRDWSLW